MTDGRKLLADYVETGSEPAFRELVDRYVNLVHSAALRMVGGDAHLAQDVVQTVFMNLARNARTLSKETMLGGWLYQHTYHVATKAVRGERRRRVREREAVKMNALGNDSTFSLLEVGPILDEAVARLSKDDRTAILLRFFEQRDFHSVAAALGSSEDGARMRVNRALQKLHAALKRRGVTVSVAMLGAALGAGAVTATPAGFAVNVAGTALAGAALEPATATTLFKIIAMTKIKTALIGSALIVGVATPLAIQHRNEVRLQKENESLRQQLDQQASLATENERLSGLLVATSKASPESLPKEQMAELIRLRGQVARLRSDAEDAARSRIAAAPNPAEQLRRELNQMPDKNIPELQLLKDDKWEEDAGKGKLGTVDGVRETLGSLRRAAKIRFAFSLGAALDGYVKANAGQLPSDAMALKPYFNSAVDDSFLQRYQMLHAGNANDVPSGAPVLAEKAPVDDRYDTIFKIGLTGYTMEGVGQWSQMTQTNTWKFQ